MVRVAELRPANLSESIARVFVGHTELPAPDRGERGEGVFCREFCACLQSQRYPRVRYRHASTAASAARQVTSTNGIIKSHWNSTLYCTELSAMRAICSEIRTGQKDNACSVAGVVGVGYFAGTCGPLGHCRRKRPANSRCSAVRSGWLAHAATTKAAVMSGCDLSMSPMKSAGPKVLCTSATVISNTGLPEGWRRIRR